MMRLPRLAGRQTSGPDDRYLPASYGSLRLTARDDPITGLIAWPDFYARLPELIRNTVAAGHSFGLAVGDVDDLKSFVEKTKSIDPASFGHLAGNQVMTRLGDVARRWLKDSGPFDACLATFGGDEIIIAAVVPDEPVFTESVKRLRDALCASLPRTVSFSAVTITPSSTDGHGDRYWPDLALEMLTAVERALFTQKQERRDGVNAVPRGFVTRVETTMMNRPLPC